MYEEADVTICILKGYYSEDSIPMFRDIKVVAEDSKLNSGTRFVELSHNEIVETE